MRCDRALVLLIVLALALPVGRSAAQDTQNLVFNGDFETGTDGWQTSGDPAAVQQTLSLDTGHAGKHAIRFDCTAFEGGTSWRHAMLCQVDKVRVRKGRLYTLTFQAKGRNIEDIAVNIALQDTKGWRKLGLASSFVPTAKWEKFEFQFVALEDCSSRSRLQLWFLSTGTLWLDDVVMTEGERVPGGNLQRPADLLKPAGSKNLVPNASFECGRWGWGTATPRYIFWGSPVNRLFGEVVEGDAPHGKRFLKIELNEKTQPVMVFDYLRPLRYKVRAPLAGNVGFIELEEGKTYVLSAWMRADRAGVPAYLGVRYLGDYTPGTTVAVDTQWKRYSWRFRAGAAPCFVLVGPDLREAAVPSCTLMIDAVQLERGDAPSDFALREPVEVSLATQRPGNVFIEGEKPQITVTAHNAGTAAASVNVNLVVTDYFDAEVAKKDVVLRAAAGSTASSVVETGLTGRGCWRVHATVDGKPIRSRLHLALIPRRTRNDSVIGINHAYGWDPLVRSAVDAGIVWDRDWSFKWEDIERTKGTFDFTEVDAQLDRELRLGHKVLGLVPFPSANWVSSAPATVNSKREPRNRDREAWKPLDDSAFRNFVSRTVSRYRGRITWWQVFNEPLYTSYALPRANGHTVEDYIRYARIFHEAAKAADPNCRVLAGPGGFSVGPGSDLDEMLKAGLLKHCDALDLHTYPRRKPPESLERHLVRVNELMDRAGGRKPLWLTEHGYYAEDDPCLIPASLEEFSEPLPNERVQAEYSVRFNLILLAHGVRKIFYHAGTSSALNRDSVQGVFFRYDGEPRKIYAAVAAFNELFGPDVQFVKDVSRAGIFRAMIFRDGKRLILAAWIPPGGTEASIRTMNPHVTLRDIVGNTMAAPSADLSSAPVFAVADDVEIRDFENFIRWSEKRR